MKKEAVMFLILVIAMLLISCSLGENTMLIDKDHRIAHKQIEELLEAIQSKNKEKLISLFSENCLIKVQVLDESVEELFDYYEGCYESYDDGAGPFVETTKENDEIYQIMESSFEVKTTKCDYRFAIQYVTQDSTNADNVGIQSMYVIKMQDDTHLEYAYWGDGKNTPGINIAIPNAE